MDARLSGSSGAISSGFGGRDSSVWVESPVSFSELSSFSFKQEVENKMMDKIKTNEVAFSLIISPKFERVISPPQKIA